MVPEWATVIEVHGPVKEYDGRAEVVLAEYRQLSGAGARIPSAAQELLQLPYITYILQVAGGNDHGERAQARVAAEIQEMNSARPFVTRITFPVTHLMSPTCFLASSKKRQSARANALQSRTSKSGLLSIDFGRTPGPEVQIPRA